MCVFCFQVRLGEPGYKERYYSEKFGLSSPMEINEVRQDVVSALLVYSFVSFFGNILLSLSDFNRYAP